MTILATLILTAVNPIEQFRKAQDTRRKSDLAQLQRALEAYYQDFDRYPAHTLTGINPYTINTGTGDGDDAIGWGKSWKPYIDVVPIDPSSSKFYIYFSGTDNQSYRLYTALDRGTKDPDACTETTTGPGCPGAYDVRCGLNNETCNFGVTSPNVSP